MQHRIARGDLDVALVQIVRGSGEHIDSMYLDDASDEWIVITEDRIETRVVDQKWKRGVVVDIAAVEADMSHARNMHGGVA
mgnify:CR=1 FL=1